MSKVLYIAGYGRSGSTILDIILDSHPDITAVGELTFLLDDAAIPSRHCSCGAAYAECGFWSRVVSSQARSSELAALVRGIEKRALVPLPFSSSAAAFKRRFSLGVQPRAGPGRGTGRPSGPRRDQHGGSRGLDGSRYSSRR